MAPAARPVVLDAPAAAEARSAGLAAHARDERLRRTCSRLRRRSISAGRMCSSMVG